MVSLSKLFASPVFLLLLWAVWLRKSEAKRFLVEDDDTFDDYYSESGQTENVAASDGVDEAFSTEETDKPDIGDSSRKKLIVYVGPHETDELNVIEFFVNYASANNESGPLETLNGWGWPLIEDELIEKPDDQVFDYLVTDPDRNDIQNVIIEGIVDTRERSTKGVIIGSLKFESVGVNPHSGYDPVGALHRLEHKLGLDPEDVTIAVTYRSPRVDHWNALWYYHFVFDDYEDFICSDDDQSDKRWEWLDVVMNPLKIAKIYHDQGWNVAVIDEQSAIHAGTDTSHMIACNLMDGVRCNNDLVEGLGDVVSDYKDDTPTNVMSLEDRRSLEQLFQDRDCHYKYEFEDEPRFRILNQQSVWSSCSSQHTKYYKQLADTDFMLTVLKSQKQCLEDNLDVSSMLEEKVVMDGKSLVIFAGPHETAGTSVTRFFAKHASEQEDLEVSASLMGWSWPKIDSEILGDTASHHTFDLLLSEAGNSTVQNILMDGIQDSWNGVENGVIIGSLDFDRVGKNPETNYDALGAIDRVVNTLGISENAVTIVLNYRSERIDQLSTVWWNHFDAETLHDFICTDDEADKRWEWIDTVMNPMKLAHAYVEEGWNVAVVEYEGTSLAGKDTSHTIACHLMSGVDCLDGWVRGLNDEITSIPGTYEIDGIDKISRKALEKLFRMRDCFYKDELKPNEKFSTIFRRELWKSCGLNDNEQFEKVTDTDFLLEVMKAVQGCGDESSQEALLFASELQRSARADSVSTFIIATVFIFVLVMILIALVIEHKKEKEKKIRDAVTNPSEGIFRDRSADATAGEGTEGPSFDGNNVEEVTDYEEVNLGNPNGTLT